MRVSIGYKKVVEHIVNYFNGFGTGVWGDHHVQTDAYVLNVYKDFPISSTRWIPYIGVGIGLANVTRSESNDGNIAGSGGAVYSQVMTGLSYSYEKFDLFGEISYGGVGQSGWEFSAGSLSQTESLRNIAGSFGIRIRL